MNTNSLKSKLCLHNLTHLTNPLTNSPTLIHINTNFPLKNGRKTNKRQLSTTATSNVRSKTIKETEKVMIRNEKSCAGSSRIVMLGAVSVGLVMILMGMDDHKALAFGPEGPLMEEFWDNVRRYALYALTVSTGALYTIFQPIYELLKNPISAILVIVIFAGGFYLVSQVIYAMVGVNEFSYDYSY